MSCFMHIKFIDEMTAGRMSVVRKGLFLCGFLHLCNALANTCTVIQNCNQTVYTISDIPHVSGVKGSCEYTWANNSKHVLANNKEKHPELVKVNSINMLVTFECFEKILYEGSCVSEEGVYSAICKVSCSGNASFQEDKEIPPTVIAAVVVILVLLIGIFGFLYYKFRDKTPRMRCWTQVGCIYTVVKMQNQGVPDVVAGNE